MPVYATPNSHHPNRLSDIAADYIRLASNKQPYTRDYIQGAYADLAAFNERACWELSQRMHIRYVEHEPYDTADQQHYDMQGGRLFISTKHNEHPVFTPEQNLQYRVVHDATGHVPASTILATYGEVQNHVVYNDDPDAVPPFSTDGELAAWANQLAYMVARNAAPTAIRAAFTETIGQLAAATALGGFPARQLAGILPQNPFARIINDLP